MSNQVERLGRWVRASREHLGWSQSDLLRHGGPSTSTQRRIEPKADGEMPADVPDEVRRNVLMAYATAFGVAYDDLRGLMEGRVQLPMPSQPTPQRRDADAAAGSELRQEINELRERVAVLEQTLNRIAQRLERPAER